MTANQDLGDFLATRCARLTPEAAGLPVYGLNRRVPGLRREEVALLAGISVEYYTRLERGSVGVVSDSVLEGVAHALQLVEAERDHLFRLAEGAANRRPARRPAAGRRTRPTVQRLLDLLPTPAFVRNGRFDILAANDIGRALYSPLYDETETPNSARFIFLSPAAGTFFLDHEKAQDDSVAFLRVEAGRDPHDRDLQDLIGELSTRSEQFRRRWAAHNVRYHRAGTKRFRHPLVGDLTLDFEALELPGDAGLRLNVYLAPPDSSSAEALALLASWATRAPARAVEPRS